MPTYIFKEQGKRKKLEFQMRMSELEDFKKKNPNFIQVPTSPSFRLKGTGWYETDFKTGKKKNLAKSDSKKDSSVNKADKTKKKDKVNTASDKSE